MLFGLFAGQPLIILGSTGPVYVFEKILYQICSDQNWDYLSLRLWIGIWVGLILLLFVAFDMSSLVCYITRLAGDKALQASYCHETSFLKVYGGAVRDADRLHLHRQRAAQPLQHREGAGLCAPGRRHQLRLHRHGQLQRRGRRQLDRPHRQIHLRALQRNPGKLNKNSLKIKPNGNRENGPGLIFVRNIFKDKAAKTDTFTIFEPIVKL